MEVIDISPCAQYWSACRKNTLIMFTLEFLTCRPNCILVYPSFDDEDIRIDGMGYRKIRIHALYTDSEEKQEGCGENQPAPPGKGPSLPAGKQPEKRAAQLGLSQLRGHRYS